MSSNAGSPESQRSLPCIVGPNQGGIDHHGLAPPYIEQLCQIRSRAITRLRVFTGRRPPCRRMEFPLAAIRGLARQRRQPMSTSAMTRDEIDEAACWLVAARLDGRPASACPLAPAPGHRGGRLCPAGRRTPCPGGGGLRPPGGLQGRLHQPGGTRPAGGAGAGLRRNPGGRTALGRSRDRASIAAETRHRVRNRVLDQSPARAGRRALRPGEHPPLRRRLFRRHGDRRQPLRRFPQRSPSA